MSNSKISIVVDGHVHIQDDLGVVYLDKDNAVHPQNMARIFSRALSNEQNHGIYRIAFGNGGTTINAASTITYKTPNDGQDPDIRTWDSRLYNETYSEIVDEGDIAINPQLGIDPGSADENTGTRPGGGSVPASDDPSTPHISGPGVRSNELGVLSEVVITAILNPSEPLGQYGTSEPAPSTESSFMFDEIGLYTAGAPAISSNGSQDADVSNKTSVDDTTLSANTAYSFTIAVDGGANQNISFVTPAVGGSGVGGAITYGDVCQAINTGNPAWNASWGGFNPISGATVSISDDGTTAYTSISGAQTYGYLRFTSDSTGSTSSISLSAGTVVGTQDLFTKLNYPVGASILTAIDGQNAGVQNNPIAPETERERLLTHLTFTPIFKSANRKLTITYTLTISVARTTD